ncbi:MAG: ATPase component BioM of energizing module of biotin ECF transporter [uncultured Sulfurovum sp.]|uniref:ATPase component BioM of energizing module of biotin ECF transporter n=1 Tax=uncultured Sulfurovum sp. TaxID=269237 RepID=A0A6S6U353_9BACT|nr:MAG: ATPase component BioM of energizing module of biotin ECF transporter [uncultured Sulfurovum sp.]
MITPLLILSNQIKSQAVPKYKRFLYKKIDFKERLFGIIGARGAGKTTLLLQYVKEETNKEALYVMAEHPLVVEKGLFAIADAFQKVGGEVLIIDEIHKIKSFEIDLKLIYDSFWGLQVIFTGSNALAIDHAKADLSRRAIIYRLPVLSFREYLELESGEVLPSYTLDEILQNHSTIAIETLSKIKPLAYFEDYLKHGAYPFYKDDAESYLQKLLMATTQVLNTDLPAIYKIEYDKINALKKMIVMLCQSEPFDINISKLCGAVELNQKTLYKYLTLLEAGGLIRILGAKSNGVSIISKPKKLYLDNTNLFNIFCNTPKDGTIRETFFASQLSFEHQLSYPKSGDFMVNERSTFEVGGRGKNNKQIKDLENAYVVSADMEVGSMNKIPLWLFGFLY